MLMILSLLKMIWQIYLHSSPFFHGQFHTKDLGMLKYIVGVEVMRSKRGIFLSQRKYVLDLLFEKRKLAAKPCHGPMA